MFNEYIDKQPIACTIFENTIKNGKICHAYLIESNGYNDTFNFVLAVVKYLICGHKNNDVQCPICNKIDNLTFEELKVIKPDGFWIKKEQIEDLQNEFLKKSIYSNKKIYIIDEVEKLNSHAAASLLKFLEEPEEGIIAILITNNVNFVLDTIISRCQIVKMNCYNEVKYNEDISRTIQKLCYSLNKDINTIEEYIESNELLIKEIIDFCIEFEMFKKNMIYKINKLIEKINNKDELLMFFDIFVLFYKDILNTKLEKNIEYFFDYLDEIRKICENSEIHVVIKKIMVLQQLKNNIIYNVNTSLLLDKLFIEFEEVENNEGGRSYV